MPAIALKRRVSCILPTNLNMSSWNIHLQYSYFPSLENSFNGNGLRKLAQPSRYTKLRYCNIYTYNTSLLDGGTSHSARGWRENDEIPSSNLLELSMLRDARRRCAPPPVSLNRESEGPPSQSTP